LPPILSDLARDYIEAKKCVAQSLAEMEAAGIDDRAAIHMLSTALVSFAMNDTSAHEHLIHSFAELEEQRKALSGG
jgi:hypothetical protein